MCENNSERSEVLIRFNRDLVVVVVVVMVDTFGLVALVALYCNGLTSNSWYMLVG